MLYLDTSFVAPLVLNEDVSTQVEGFLTGQTPGSLAISQWTRVEFCSLVARQVRMKHFSARTAEKVLAEFDSVVDESLEVWLPSTADYDLARGLLARFHSGLRGGDALHLAIAANHEADTVLTLDEGLLRAARLLKIPAKRGIRMRGAT